MILRTDDQGLYILDPQMWEYMHEVKDLKQSSFVLSRRNFFFLGFSQLGERFGKLFLITARLI